MPGPYSNFVQRCVQELSEMSGLCQGFFYSAGHGGVSFALPIAPKARAALAFPQVLALQLGVRPR